MTAALRWTCPECQDGSVSVVGLDNDDAAQALQAYIVSHLEAVHPGSQANAHALSQWLADTGTLVHLWGGPHDGDAVWVPPGELPDVIGVHRTTDGKVTPVRGVMLQVLPDVAAYRLTETFGGVTRYAYDGRSRRPPRDASDGWHTR